MTFGKQSMNVYVFLICFLIVMNKGFAGKDGPTPPSKQSETSENSGTGDSTSASSEHDQDIGLQGQRAFLRGLGIQNGTEDVPDTNMAPVVSVDNVNVTRSSQTSTRVPHEVSITERPVETTENLGANRSSINHQQPRYPPYSRNTSRQRTFRGWPRPADLVRAGFFYAGINGSAINHQRPYHRKYSHVASRQGTFRGWPKEKRQRPADLAMAGFYYTDFDDTVVCFCCGGELRNWEPEGDPWVEHARWFPNCEFVRRNKGTAFVRQVQRHYNRLEEHGLSELQRQQPTSRQSMNEAQGQYPVDRREVKARMDTPIVQEVIRMGFSYRTVWAVIENRLRKTGDDFPNASSLLKAVFAFMDAKLKWIRRRRRLYERHSSSRATNDDVKSLMEENQRLKERKMCKICMDEDISVVFLPCGHLISCLQCAQAMRSCPVCRATIRGIMRVFFS